MSIEPSFAGVRDETEMGRHSFALPGGRAIPSLRETLERVEREMLLTALEAARGNKAKAARILGISERIMGLRVRKHRIDPRSFRRSRKDRRT